MPKSDKPKHHAITVVSTYTTDHVTLGDGRSIAIPGGPAHYIGVALTHLGRSATVVTGDHAHVEVVSSRSGEAYVIPTLRPIDMPDPLTGDAVILSPINREIPPAAVPPILGLLAIDLQGFVRLPGNSTDHLDREVDLHDLLRRAAVVKASSDELKALDFASQDALRHTLLLETRGAAGMIVHGRDGPVAFPATSVATVHTIGAGDTLLAAFVVAMLNRQAPLIAAEWAIAFTADMLSARQPA